VVGNNVQEEPSFHNTPHFLTGQKAPPDLQTQRFVSGWEGVNNWQAFPMYLCGVSPHSMLTGLLVLLLAGRSLCFAL